MKRRNIVLQCLTNLPLVQVGNARLGHELEVWYHCTRVAMTSTCPHDDVQIG